jgi:hypothetical protein
MSELVFERGLFATLAAALIVPELTTFLLFVLVALAVSNLLARQAWSFLRIAPPDQSPSAAPAPIPAEPAN